MALTAALEIQPLRVENGLVLAPAAVMASSGPIPVEGFSRLRGNFHLAGGAAAAGFPRIRQSVDGVTWSRVDVLLQDAAQTDFQYPFDVPVLLPYASIELTNGAALVTLRLAAWGVPA